MQRRRRGLERPAGRASDGQFRPGLVCRRGDRGAIRGGVRRAGRGFPAAGQQRLSRRADGAGFLRRGLAEHPQPPACATAELRSRRGGPRGPGLAGRHPLLPGRARRRRSRSAGPGDHRAGRRERRLPARRRRDDDAGRVPQAGDECGDAAGRGDSPRGPDHSQGDSRAADRDGLLRPVDPPALRRHAERRSRGQHGDDRGHRGALARLARRGGQPDHPSGDPQSLAAQGRNRGAAGEVAAAGSRWAIRSAPSR